jgi:hypothetical protein
MSYFFYLGYIFNEAFIDPIEFSHDHSNLGAALNGFSLNETGPLLGPWRKLVRQWILHTYQLPNLYKF